MNVKHLFQFQMSSWNMAANLWLSDLISVYCYSYWNIKQSLVYLIQSIRLMQILGSQCREVSGRSCWWVVIFGSGRRSFGTSQNPLSGKRLRQLGVAASLPHCPFQVPGNRQIMEGCHGKLQNWRSADGVVLACCSVPIMEPYHLLQPRSAGPTSFSFMKSWRTGKG